MPKVIARLGSRLKTRRGALRPVPGLRAECCCSTHDGHLQACIVLPVYRQIVAILLSRLLKYPTPMRGTLL